MDRPRSGRQRMLFLDDDRKRAAAIQASRPDAIWVQTTADCIEQLAQPWDEVHLDHDLGGEVYVDSGREDCGMAVVRWLCAEPRPHLSRTRFIVHTHNLNASCAMLLQLETAGYSVQLQPFGATATAARKTPTTRWTRRVIDGVLRCLRPLLNPRPRY